MEDFDFRKWLPFDNNHDRVSSMVVRDGRTTGLLTRSWSVEGHCMAVSMARMLSAAWIGANPLMPTTIWLYRIFKFYADLTEETNTYMHISKVCCASPIPLPTDLFCLRRREVRQKLSPSLLLCIWWGSAFSLPEMHLLLDDGVVRRKGKILWSEAKFYLPLKYAYCCRSKS